MIVAKTIEILKNLSEFDFGNQIYDFHNDYACQKISFEKEKLAIIFKKIADSSSLSLIFNGVDIAMALFFNVSTIEYLTIDTIYRGRVLLNDGLVELRDNKAYFYLEFYEGQTLEFWAESMAIEKE